MKELHVNNEIALYTDNRIANWKDYLSLPIILWVMVWLGINTGPWILKQTPDSLIGWLHYCRTLLPLFALSIAYLVMAERGNFNGKAIFGPVGLWLLYGFISLVACIFAPKPLYSAYWAINYLAALVSVALFLQGEDKISRAIQLNHFSWFVTFTLLFILLLVAREDLFVDYRYGWITGYGLVNRIDTVANSAMSRSSGMARFAAVPGIVAFVFLLTGSGVKKVFWLILFVSCSLLIWFMQSRGAILGFAFSLAFVLLFLGRRSRLFGLIGIIFLGLLQFTELIPEKAARYVKIHFYRGQSYEELLTLTGRTRAWKKAWREIKKAPILGRGPQSDRYLIKEHVHNTYLYALLQSGIVGTVTFIGGLVWAWLLFFKAILLKRVDQPDQRVHLIQSAGILAFFTVRSIPEVCGAMFGVDLLVMLPAMAYIGLLGRESNKAGRFEDEMIKV
jgi:O-antigen ligase